MSLQLFIANNIINFLDKDVILLIRISEYFRHLSFLNQKTSLIFLVVNRDIYEEDKSIHDRDIHF